MSLALVGCDPSAGVLQKFLLTTTAFLLMWNTPRANGALHLNGVPCQQKICTAHQYCSEFDSTCRPCVEICDSNTHNFDQSVCENQCQDYILDTRYVRKSDKNSDTGLQETVSNLSRMVTVNLTLVSFMLIVLGLVLFVQLYRWSKKKNITWFSIRNKLYPKKITKDPDGNAGKPDLRLDIPTDQSSSYQSTQISSMQSPGNRKPTEDDSLAYAYDNHAMHH